LVCDPNEPPVLIYEPTILVTGRYAGPRADDTCHF
jgi:hypothetical protein